MAASRSRKAGILIVPTGRRAFFHHGGMGGQIGLCLSRGTPRPLGVAGQIIPWNFPLLMAAWKIAPALACGNTVVLKPSKTTSITALHLAQFSRKPACPTAWSTSSPARPKRARHLPSSRCQQDCFHRLDGGRQDHRQACAGTGKRLTLNWAARRPTSSWKTRRWTRRSRASSGNLFQPGPCLLRRFAAVCAGRRFCDGDQEIARPHPDLARWQSAGQKHGRRRDQFRRAIGKNPRTGAMRHRQGRGSGTIECALPARDTGSGRRS